MKDFIFTYSVGNEQLAREQMNASGNTSVQVEGPFSVYFQAADFNSARLIAIEKAQQHCSNTLVNAIHITNTTDNEQTNVKNNSDYDGGVWTEQEWTDSIVFNMAGG